MSLSIQIARIKKRCRFNTNYASTNTNKTMCAPMFVRATDRFEYVVRWLLLACSKGRKKKKLLPFELSK